MSQERIFLMAGGGTGGHVIPALAVARELRSLGERVLFTGTRQGLEARLVPADGFPMAWVEIGGLKRVGLRRAIRTLWQLPREVLKMYGMLHRRRGVAAVFSMGGYAAGPAVLAACLRGTPLVIMEPNAMPGLTNRRVAGRVARALLSFPEAARWFPADRVEITGLPVREEFFRLPPKPRGDPVTVLITGGSQGSRRLNVAARESWPWFRGAASRVRFLHQTGEAMAAEWRDAFSASGLEGEITPFLADMPAAFASADLVVCRAGAGAVAELAAAGKPSLLTPFPFAADQHQLRNAQAMEAAGAARLVPDAELTGERLFREVTALVSEPGALERMGKAARAVARPGAARRAAQVLREVAR